MEDNDPLQERDYRAFDRANAALQRNMNDLQPPVFAGRPGDRFKKWLVKFNHFAGNEEWTPQRKLEYLGDYLVGDAFEIYSHLPDEDKADWESLKTALGERLIDSSEPQASLSQLMQVSMGTNSVINGPPTFQRFMDFVLSGLQWESSLVFLDDILVSILGPDHYKYKWTSSNPNAANYLMDLTSDYFLDPTNGHPFTSPNC